MIGPVFEQIERRAVRQRDCHERLRQASAVVMVADGVDEAVAALQAMGILPDGQR